MKDEWVDWENECLINLKVSFPNVYRNMFDRIAQVSSYPMRPSEFSCYIGWQEIIIGLSMQLERMINELPENEQSDYYAIQIKEKFGGLRFYMSQSTDEMTLAIIETEKKSYTICESCGEKAICQNHLGHAVTLCDDHLAIREERLRDKK